MNDIKNNELKISYLKDKISKLPHGSFVPIRGLLYVVVTYDPFEPAVNSKNRRRYRITSNKGRFYTPLIEEYIKLKKELNELEYRWNLIYRFPPRQIEYPLKKRKYSIFDGDFFDNAVSNSNGLPVEHPIEYKGMIFRSKNELLTCQLIESKGYKVKVEPLVGSSFDTLFPDIVFKVPEQYKCIGLEIDGALDREQYAYKSRNRRKGYLEKGFQIGKDIVFLDLADPHSFYPELFETQIRLAVEASLDDIVFPGED